MRKFRWLLGPVLVVSTLGLVAASPAGAALEPAYSETGVPLIGSCGNTWAKTGVVRQYAFNTHRSGNDVWRQTTLEGDRFTTFAGASPGACSPSLERGVSIVGGIHSIEIRGGMYIYVKTAPGSFDATAVCPAPCTTSQFVASFYGANTTWTSPSGFINFHVPTRSAYFSLVCRTVYVRTPLDWPGSMTSFEDIASTC